MLDVRRLTLLRELALRGTIAAVATALHQTPSAVSQQLTQLEREARVPLLRKAGRRLQLTPQAEILVRRTEEVLTTLEAAETELAASLTQATGVIRVAIFQSVALALLPAVLDVLEREHPRSPSSSRSASPRPPCTRPSRGTSTSSSPRSTRITRRRSSPASTACRSRPTPSGSPCRPRVRHGSRCTTSGMRATPRG
ncbi:hypothetical protein GCM10025869_03610 [Homoserinibacter gongjuensis]|uniref:HTH lysR-type domain-containing protein n=1 Tax=Homoserinibacter gongjuensis TaxID=1162968 RepID=A0ABQ6JNF8_9MICO|nr:hypothetical protein GCM10025869_03610 [Homoserinibacter gongjuensis]